MVFKKGYARKKKIMAMGKRRYRRSKISGLLPKDTGKFEKKYADTTLNANAPDNGYIACINNIAQATAENGRIGNRINLKSVQYRLAIRSNAVRTNTPVRVMLVYDKECNGVLPAVVGTTISNSILLLDGGAGNPGTEGVSNMNNKDRYVILSDKVVNFIHYDATLDAELPMEKFKYLNTYTQYNSGGGAIGQINSGALYIVILSDIPAGLNHQPLVYVNTRVRFTDE